MLRRLTAAPRSRAELAGDLARRGVPGDVAAGVLDRFEEVGLVDDTAYAELVLRSQRASRGLGRRGVQAELRRRGVDDAVARDTLAAVSDEDEEAAARALVDKRLPALARHPREVRERRLLGMLGRKGYGGALAARVVRDALTD